MKAATSQYGLATNRVKALAEYIRKKHDFKPELFTLDNGSEDWEGLKAKVEADRSVPAREAVLAIINSNDGRTKDAAPGWLLWTEGLLTVMY